MRRLSSILLSVLLGTAVLASCGDDSSGNDDKAADGSTTSIDPDDGSTTSTAEPGPVVPRRVEITAKDFKYEGAPKKLGAGPVTIVLTNMGKEEHQATLMRLEKGVSIQDLQKAETQAEAFSKFRGFGGPNAAGPGETVTTTQVLDPGTYVLLCFIPTSDGTAHAQKGMFQQIEVTGKVPANSTVGETKGAITLKDFEFGVPEGFDGKGTFAVKNEGPQAHELSVYKLAAGKTLADARQYFAGPRSGLAPMEFAASGVAALDKDREASIDLNLTTGSYVFVCFLPNVAKEGESHVTTGMIREVAIA